MAEGGGLNFASGILLFKLYIIYRNIIVEIISIWSSDSLATFSTMLLIRLFKCNFMSALLLTTEGGEGEGAWLLLRLFP